MNMNWIVKIIQNLISRDYYGKLTISIEKGKIVHVEKKESLRP